MRTRTVDMTKGNILKHIVKFAVPIMISGILQTLYNAADMAVVGQFAENGDKSLAAVGSTGAAISFFINLFMGLSSATNVIVARKFGAGNKSGVSKAVHTAVTVAIVIGVCCSVAGFFLARPLLLWMGSPEDVIDKSTLYMQVYFVGIPAMILYNFGSAILRAVGDAKRPTYYLMGAGVINVLLNLLFVIVFKMDVAGVAVATMIAQAIAAVLVFRSLIKTNDCYKLCIKKIRATAAELREIIVMGIPAGIQGCAFSLSNLIIQSSINDCGSIAMAGNAAGASIDGMIYVTVNAFFHAAITFTGQNYGAHDFKRLRRGYWTTVGAALAFGSIVSVLVCTFAGELLRFYTSSPGAIVVGMAHIKYICSFYMLCGILEVGAGVLRGIGVATRSMIICVLGTCGIRLLMVEIGAPYHTVKDLIILYVSYPISWVVTGVVLAIFFFTILRAREQKWKEHLEEKQREQQEKRNSFMEFVKDKLLVKIFDIRDEMGKASAKDIADCIRAILDEKEEVNMVFAAAPSQSDMLLHLCREEGIAWERINAFHMDEYIGLNPDAPQCFSNFLKREIFDLRPFKSVNLINAGAKNAEEEAKRYASLLRENKVDIVCMGIGENGHIAFNDPHEARFDDPEMVKVVTLDEMCRNQQVNDGCFEKIDDVPKYALTLTIPALMSAKYNFCVVPAPTKANAVKRTVFGAVSEECPATALRVKDNAILYCDADSSALIKDNVK